MHLLNTVLLPARAYIFSGRTHAISWVCKAALHNLRTYERRLVHKTFLGYIFAALGESSIYFLLLVIVAKVQHDVLYAQFYCTAQNERWRRCERCARPG